MPAAKGNKYAKGNKGGAPSTYKKEYCKRLVAHMSKGFSYESFAGLIGVSKTTLNNWAEANKEFLTAKEEGFAKSRFTWEKIGINLAKSNKGNATSFVFNMKNRFPEEWREKVEREDTVKLNMSWHEEKTYEAKPEANPGN